MKYLYVSLNETKYKRGNYFPKMGHVSQNETINPKQNFKLIIRQVYQTGSLSQNGNTRNGVGYFFLWRLVRCGGWVTPQAYIGYNF